MKLNRKNLFFTASAAITVALAAPSAQAVNLYWDTNGTGSAGSGAATGTWGTDAFWSTDSTGNNVGPVTLTATTSSADDLFFSAGTTGTGGTVAVSGARAARKITFEEGAITLSGGTSITLAGGGGLTVDTLAGNATVSTALTATGKNTFIVGDGRTLTLDTGAFTRTTRGAINVQLGTGSTLTSTKTGLATGGMVNGIIGPWASIGTGTSTRYATFTGNNITALTGTAAATAANVTDTTGAFNYDVAATTGAFAANASVNTIRYTGATGGTLTSTTSFTTKGIMLTGASNLTLLGGAGWSSGAAATELVVNVVDAASELRMTGASAAITGSINKTGAGIFDMRSGANHTIGNITVNEGILITNHLNGDGIGGNATINSGGTLRWGGGSKHQNAAVFTINAGGTLDIVAQDDLIGSIAGAGNITGTTGRIQVQNATATFSGVMSGSGVRFLINDDGAANDYTLSGLNTYGGTTTLERGILRINSIGNVNGSASSLGTPTSIANGNIAIGRLAFPGTLVYTGTGHGTDRQITIGTNTATPVVTDTGGATIQADGAANAALTFNATNFNTQTNAATGVGADRVLTLQGTSTGLNTISGIIQDNLVSGTATGTAKVGVTKAQAGTWVLSGANTYTGTTTVSGGILKLNNATALPGGIGNIGGTSALNIAGGIVGLTADFSRGYGTTADTFQITAGGGFAAYGTNRTVTPGTLAFGSTPGTNIVGTLTLGAADADSTLIWASNLSFGGSQRTVQVNNGSATVDARFSGVLSGGTSSGIDKTGAGTLEFTNTSNSYSGATTITAGTLRLGAAGVIPNTSNVSVTGTLDLNGFNETINNLTGAGTVDNTAASTNATLTLNGGGTFSGAITDSGASATLALVKSGSPSDTILSGNNSYSGGTTLNSGGAGRMFIEGANALPTTGAVQVNSGATLNFNTAASPTFNQSITLASGATLAVRQAATLGNVTLPTSGNVIFNNDDAATVAFSLGNNVALTGNLTVQVGGNNLTVGAVTLGGNISGGFGLTKTSTGTLILSGANGYTGATTVSGGTLALGAAGTIDDTSGVVLGTGTLDVSAKGGGYSVDNLSGSGTVIGSLTVSTQLAIGASPGTINFENLALTSGTTYLYDLNDTGNTADLGNVTGTLNLGSAILDLVQLGTFTLGEKFTLFSYDTAGDLTGTFAGLADGAEFNDADGRWLINYDDGTAGLNGGSRTLFVTVTAVPEPNVAALIGAFGGILLLRRRR